MNIRHVRLLSLLAALLAGLATFPAAGATQDVIYLTDGRILTGNVVEERRTEVVFEIVDRSSGISMNMTFATSDIVKIDRDVEIAEEPETPSLPRATSRPDDRGADRGRGWGRRLVDATDDESLPSFYIVPMGGQMGTDVSSEIYKDVIEDIRAVKPDFVVIELESRDVDNHLYNQVDPEDRSLASAFDDYRVLVEMFRTGDMKSIPQVMWIKDAFGVSSSIAMAWPDIYMHPEARLGGMEQARHQINFDKWADNDVRGKMTAAFMSWLKGYLEHGNYDLVLAEAMVLPDRTLSGTWRGREVEWSLDTHGEKVIDGSDQETTNFTAKLAEDMCISKGTAEDVEELAFLLGYREFRVAPGSAEEIIDDYVENWRRLFEQTEEWWADYEQFMGWASGEDTLKYLGQAKSRLERIVMAMERYDAVETRWGRRGLRKFDLVTLIEQLKERIISIKNSGRGGGGGGAGGQRPGGRGGRR